MKKRIIAVGLSGVMALSLAACGGGNGDSTGSSNGTADASSGSGEVKKVIMAFPTYTGAPADTQLVQDAMNAITVDKLGIEVELQISDIGSYSQNMTLALSGGETVDLAVTVGFAFANAVSQDYVIDLESDDLITTYGQGIIDAIGWDYLDACRVGGTLYGVPQNKDVAQGRGCAAVATEYLDGIGYEFDHEAEIVKITQEELDDIYAQLHEKYPDVEVYRPTGMSMQQFSNVDPVGGSVFGVLLDYGKELNVVNLFTSDFYKEYCERMYMYNQNGYISQDAATDTTGVTELVKAGTLMSYTTGGKPGIKAQETSLCGRDMTIFQTLEDYVTSTSIASMPWVIPVTTSDAAAAMTLLNEFFTNPELANLLAWGIEGTHYVVGEDGLATFADGIDASTSGWNHSMGWMMPNQFITEVWEGNSPDLWTEMDNFNKGAEKSAASGFTFDNASVANEITAVQNAYNEYQASIEYGFTDPETGIPEMNEKLMTAGLDKIIAEKQRQLDEWAQTQQ